MKKLLWIYLTIICLGSMAAAEQNRRTLDAMLADSGSFIENWRLIGPFPFDTDRDISEYRYLSDHSDVDFTWDVKHGSRLYSWKPARTDSQGIVDINKVYSGHNLIVYAATHIESESDTTVFLDISSDDGYECWLNGTKLASINVFRPIFAGTERLRADFRKGTNTLLIKVSQGAGQWQFVVYPRKYDPDFFNSKRGIYFPEKNRSPVQPPSFEEIRSSLPEPVLQNDPGLVELYYDCWKVVFDNLRLPPEQSSLISAYVDQPQSDDIYQWDSIFTFMFTRYGSQAFSFVTALDNFYSCQHADGYICRQISLDKGADVIYGAMEDTINPPLYAWAELSGYRITCDRQRLGESLAPIEQYIRWIETARIKPGTVHNLFFNTPEGSGMGNMPRDGSGWVDLSSQMVLEYESLAEICSVLGQVQKSLEYRKKAAGLSARINKYMWDAADGMYYDVDDNGKFIKCKSAACFWPMIAGICSPAQAQALRKHLENPAEFARPVMFPTLSADHQGYNPAGGYWRGGVCAPANYMIIKGLERYGFEDLAAKASAGYLACISQVYRETGSFWEVYAPEKYKPGTVYGHFLSRKDFVGWTGLGPVAMLIEDVIGIRPDAQENTVTWHLRRDDVHGVRNLPFAGSTISLVYHPAGNEGQSAYISIDNDRPIRLNIIKGSSSRFYDVPLGSGRLILD